MSHDELLPDSPLRSEEQAAAGAEREASSADAPPAPATRARRTRKAGTAAASAPVPTDTPQPARATRSRKKKAEAAEETSPAPATTLPEKAVEVAAATADESAGTTDKPARRRTGTRASAKPITPTPSAASETAEDNASVSALENAPAASPARPRSRRKKTEPASETPVNGLEATVPDVEAVSESAPAALPETVETPARPARRRNTRSRSKPAAEAPAQADASAIADPPEAVASPETPALETDAEPDKPGRRRRTPRSRRGKAGRTETAVEPAAALAEAPEAPVSEPVAPAEDESSDTTPGSRARRSRRSSRSRRGKPERVETGEEEMAAEVVAEAAAPPLVESAPPIDLSTGTHLIPIQGNPTIHIDGTPFSPVLFFGNVEGERNRQRVLSEVRRAAQAGVHLHSTLVDLPCPLTEDSSALDEIDRRLRAVLEADPDGYIMPRIVFYPARGWKREYPMEIATYADGSTGDPSIASERFWQEADRSLTMLIGHLQQQQWGKRIFGYHLERGEWFQPADSGYDRSLTNRDAFRDWLREKYKNSLVALRAAWYDGDVQFHTAEIPPLITKPVALRAFYETRRERRYIDFNEFTSEITALRLTALAKTVKKATEYQALVSVCYGYTLEFGHPFSGHLALTQLLASSAIDLITGPPSYRDRKPGGPASFPAPVASPPLYGKLWLSEDDTKTWLAPPPAPDDFNPRLGDRQTTEQAQLRALGTTLVNRTGIGFMDLWGEGWLDEEGIWERLGNFAEYYAASQAAQERPTQPEVVALIDEKSLMHIQRGETFFRKMTAGLRDALQRAGISYSIHLQSDVLLPNFPTQAKLYLFLTPYRLTVEVRTAIREKLQRDNKTLVWLFAPGACEERPGAGGAMEESVTSTVGLTLRQQEWNSEVGSRIVEPYHPLTQSLPGREIGARERLNPSFFVDDPDATILAEYQSSGLASLGVKNFGTWRSVFVGEPTLPLELLRGICRYAGVHLWTTKGDDVVSVGNGWAMLHVTRDGQHALFLPEATGLYDMTEGRLLAEETREYRTFLKAGTTRLFCIGPPRRFVAMGLPNALPSAATRPPIAPEPKPEPPREPVSLVLPVSTAATRADVETLEAILKMDLTALEDDFPPPEEEVFEGVSAIGGAAETLEAVLDPNFGSNGRRRRRRGGRGRGRRREGEGAETPEGAAEAVVEAALPAPIEPSPNDPLLPVFPVLTDEESNL